MEWNSIVSSVTVGVILALSSGLVKVWLTVNKTADRVLDKGDGLKPLIVRPLYEKLEQVVTKLDLQKELQVRDDKISKTISEKFKQVMDKLDHMEDKSQEAHREMSERISGLEGREQGRKGWLR